MWRQDNLRLSGLFGIRPASPRASSGLWAGFGERFALQLSLIGTHAGSYLLHLDCAARGGGGPIWTL